MVAQNTGIRKMEKLIDAGENLEIWRVNYSDIKEQPKNARVMPPEAFERLAANMRTEGRMETLPFGVKRGNHIELISGHHRTRAAVVAGILDFLILVDTREDLSTDAVKSKQLSHNSLSGTDDVAMLAEIFNEIEDLELKMAAFIDEEELLAKAVEKSAGLVSEQFEIEWPVLSIAFLPTQREKFEALAERLAKQVSKDTDTLALVPEDLARSFTDMVNRLGRCEDIRTMGNIISRLVAIGEKYLDEQEAET